jgi:hypothetical protein
LFTAVGATALVVLTACGGGDAGGGGDADNSGQGDIASITSPAAGGGSAQPTTADSDAGRPQIRLDSTQEEVNRMYDAWSACLEENGAQHGGKTREDAPAVKACTSKEPLDPPELDPAKNPDYSDDVRLMIKCMNGHGIKSVATDGGWGLEDGASMNAPNFNEILTDCQVRAFGDDE